MAVPIKKLQSTCYIRQPNSAIAILYRLAILRIFRVRTAECYSFIINLNIYLYIRGLTMCVNAVLDCILYKHGEQVGRNKYLV